MKLHHHIKISLATAVAVTAGAVGGGIFYDTTQATIRLTVDGNASTVQVPASTVAEALEQADVSLDQAIVEPALATEVEDGTEITVRYTKPVRATIDGEAYFIAAPVLNVEEGLEALGVTEPATALVSEDLSAPIPLEGLPEPIVVSTVKTMKLVSKGEARTVVTNAPTVGAVLEEERVLVDSNDELNQKLQSPTREGLRIKVVKIQVEKATAKKHGKVKTVVREDPTLLQGESEVVRKGSPRVVKMALRLTYADGELREREVLRRQVVSRGAARVVVKGTGEPLPTYSPESTRALGLKMMLEAGFDRSQWTCLEQLWTRESQWNPAAHNPSSGAHGIPQSLPGSKMATHGADWATNPETQIAWGLDYIKGRYGEPCGAWAHSERIGWY